MKKFKFVRRGAQYMKRLAIARKVAKEVLKNESRS